MIYIYQHPPTGGNQATTGAQKPPVRVYRVYKPVGGSWYTFPEFHVGVLSVQHLTSGLAPLGQTKRRAAVGNAKCIEMRDGFGPPTGGLYRKGRLTYQGETRKPELVTHSQVPEAGCLLATAPSNLLSWKKLVRCHLPRTSCVGTTVLPARFGSFP